MIQLSTDTKRKYAIIAAIATRNTPTLADITQLTGIPASSLKRQIAQLRANCSMDIRFIPSGHNKGRTGHYHIYEWGVFDRTEFLVRYGSILDQ